MLKKLRLKAKPLIWFPMTNYMTIDQSKKAKLSQSRA